MSRKALEWDQQEKRNKKKSAIYTFLIHVLLLLLSILLGMNYPEPPPAEEGILINFGTADLGKGEIQPKVKEEVVEKVVPKETQPVENQPEVVEEKVITQETEEAPAISKKEEEKVIDEKVEEPEKTEPDKVVTEKKEEKPVEKAEEVKEQPEVNKNALFPGSKDESQNESQSEGENIYKGDQGAENGDPNALNHEGENSSGLGDDGIGYDLAGRKMIGRPLIEDKSQKKGMVVISIKVDNQGNVISANFQLKGSNTQDPYLVKLAKEAALKAKFNPTDNGPEVQRGTITFNFKLQ